MSNQIIGSFFNKLILQDNKTPYLGKRRPLLIASSGGGGHISAILGLISYLKAACLHCEFDTYTPKQAPKRDNPKAKVVKVGAHVTNQEGYFSFISTNVIQPLFKQTPLPVFPTLSAIYEEVQRLESTQARPYLDMLLDIYPSGYEYAAIWNIHQKEGYIEDLKKMIAYQPEADKLNWKASKTYFSELLDKAVLEGRPYTEIISTQVLSIPALCEVVYHYNQRYKTIQNIPKLYIHQYFTDLPTKGATHFFRSLNNIKLRHKSQMILYGVGLNNKIIQSELLSSTAYHKLVDIPPNANPMVRPAFKKNSNSLHDSFERSCKITFKAYEYIDGEPVDLNYIDEISISPKSKVASITLGSQACCDTLSYIHDLLTEEIDKIFVFGGYKNHIYPYLDEIVTKIASIYDNKTKKALSDHAQSYNEFREYLKKKIVVLGHQDDKNTQSILTRSDIVIKRGGGLSVMEEMSLLHHPDQIILIHHADADSVTSEPTSGISWEDENTNTLIQYLRKKGLFVKKTTPRLFLKDLDNAKQIHQLKSELRDIKETQIEAIGHLAALDMSMYHDFSRVLTKKQREELASSILDNNRVLIALNQLSQHNAYPLSQAIIKIVIATPKLVCLGASGQYGPHLLLHLLSHQTHSPVKFKSINAFLNLLSVLYEPKYSYYLLEKDFTPDEIASIKENIFHSILSHHDLHDIVFTYLRRSRSLKHALGTVMRDVLIYQCKHIDLLYHSRLSIKHQANSKDLTSYQPFQKYHVVELTAERILLVLDYLITRGCFKVSVFNRGLFNINLERIESTIHYINEKGEKKSNVVPKHMMTIHHIIQQARKSNNAITYTLALDRIKSILDSKTKKRYGSLEYRVFHMLLNTTSLNQYSHHQ